MFRIVVGLVVVTLMVGCGKENNPLTFEGDGPQIVALSPGPEQGFITHDQLFLVEFSESMNTQSVQTNFTITAAQKPVAGSFVWNSDGTSMTFQTENGFSPGDQVQLNFGSGMRSRWGQPLVGQDGQSVGSFRFGCLVYGYPTTFDSNGQQIYFTSTSASGQPITSVMGDNTGSYSTPGPAYGPTTGMMGRGMMGRTWGDTGGKSGHIGMACVSCHGPDGRGGRYLGMGTVQTPDIRYTTLTAQRNAGEDGHAHESYTDDLIKRAITQGLEADGEPLNFYMPRWSMSEQDLEELLAFLKTL